jgi:dephospho-CoA kinase
VRRKKLLVGIVGRMGCGKSAVAQILSREYGFAHIDVDRFGHKVLDKEKDAIVKEFGPELLDSEGNVNRKILGDLVFSDGVKLAKLNSISHPAMVKEVEKVINNSESDCIVLDAALLFEMGMDDLCEFIITVEAPDEIIMKRIRENRDWDDERIRRVLEVQNGLTFIQRKTDFIIFNNGDDKKLEKQVEIFVQEIL